MANCNAVMERNLGGEEINKILHMIKMVHQLAMSESNEEEVGNYVNMIIQDRFGKSLDEVYALAGMKHPSPNARMIIFSCLVNYMAQEEEKSEDDQAPPLVSCTEFVPL